MPVSRLRPNRRVQRKLSAKDVLNIQTAYSKKLEEYSEMELNPLKELETNKTVKGTYLIALTEAIKVKTIQPFTKKEEAEQL